MILKQPNTVEKVVGIDIMTLYLAGSKGVNM